jgi:hypothetical protein
MADAALFIGWGNAVRGRERQALKVFGDAIDFYTGLQQAGEIESFEPVFLEPHGGDLVGFILIRGDGDKLGSLRNREDFVRLNSRAGLIVDGFGVVGAAVASGIQEQMGYFQAAIEEIVPQ